MELFEWYWWAGAALVLVIAEIFVPGFFLFCLGLGCGGAALVAGLGGGPAWQLVAFSVVALIGFFTLRPILMKKFWRLPEVRTNMDALAGQRGRVTQAFEPGLRLGRVAVAGDDWRAESTSDSPLREGDTIEVVRVDSNTLIVKPLENR